MMKSPENIINQYNRLAVMLYEQRKLYSPEQYNVRRLKLNKISNEMQKKWKQASVKY